MSQRQKAAPSSATPEIRSGDSAQASAAAQADALRTELIRDAAGRLIEKRTASHHISQRTQHPQAGYVKDNLVRVFEDKRFFYDGHGRLIRKLSGKHTAQTFRWDDESRLVEVETTRRPGTEQQTTQTTRFDYDALGRQTRLPSQIGVPRLAALG